MQNCRPHPGTSESEPAFWQDPQGSWAGSWKDVAWGAGLPENPTFSGEEEEAALKGWVKSSLLTGEADALPKDI